MSVYISQLRQWLVRLQDPMSLSRAEKARLDAMFTAAELATIYIQGVNKQVDLELGKWEPLYPQAELRQFVDDVNLIANRALTAIRLADNLMNRINKHTGRLSAERIGKLAERRTNILRQSEDTGLSIQSAYNALSNDAKMFVELPPDLLTDGDWVPRTRDSWTCADGSLSGLRLAYIDYIDRMIAALPYSDQWSKG